MKNSTDFTSVKITLKAYSSVIKNFEEQCQLNDKFVSNSDDVNLSSYLNRKIQEGIRWSLVYLPHNTILKLWRFDSQSKKIVYVYYNYKIM